MKGHSAYISPGHETGPLTLRQTSALAACEPYATTDGVTTILPRCLLASMCSNALPISANGQTLSIGSSNLQERSGISRTRNFHLDHINTG